MSNGYQDNQGKLNKLSILTQVITMESEAKLEMPRPRRITVKLDGQCWPGCRQQSCILRALLICEKVLAETEEEALAGRHLNYNGLRVVVQYEDCRKEELDLLQPVEIFYLPKGAVQQEDSLQEQRQRRMD